MGQTWKLIYRLEKTAPLNVWRKLRTPPVPNLEGDRDIEYSWVMSRIPEKPGKLMDFACGKSFVALLAARRGWDATAVDLEPIRFAFQHPGFHFKQGDLFDLPLEEESFDVVVNCSAVEHVGLSGRYGIEKDEPEKDLAAMQRLLKLTKKGGIMIMTAPVGKDAVFRPFHRVYGEKRLPKVLEGWDVVESEYWVKDAKNDWVQVDEKTALAREPVAHCYGLGLYVLRRPRT